MTRAAAILDVLADVLAREQDRGRLTLALRWIVAELRASQLRIPVEDPTAARIVTALRTILDVRATGRIGYIFGLANDASADWELIAAKARRRVAAVSGPNADAEAVPNDDSTNAPTARL